MVKRYVLVIGLFAALLVGLGTPSLSGAAHAAAPQSVVASSVEVHPAFLDKTRFLLHMGLAYFAFHHFVWTRYKSNQLNLSHKANLVKAGIALLFAYHEFKTAYNIANGSSSKLLKALVSPLNALLSKAQSLGNSMKAGNFSSSDLNSFNDLTNSFSSTAAKNGFSIKDITTLIPGA